MYEAKPQEQPWHQPFWKPARGKRMVLFYLILIHVVAVVGLILFPLPGIRILGLTLLLTALGGFGTTICYHRMLAHRTLKLNKSIEHLLIFWAIFNGSGAPASWVAYHRLHHARTDTPEDISSPKQGGFWWAHLRWLYQSPPADKKQWCPELTRRQYRIWTVVEVPVILLSLFFAPLYLRTRVPTLPDYLERRYNRNCRDMLSVVSLFSAIVIHIGVALFTASSVLCYIFGVPDKARILGLSPTMFFIIALGVLTGIYTVVGGLLAVVWTESAQTVLLLVGAIAITVAGYHAIGGWDALATTLATYPHPLAGIEGAKDGIALSTKSFLNMAHPGGDKTVLGNVPWYSILLGYPVIGIWYWCCDQTIVQRVLAAKDEKHARLGPLFCAFIKILPVFFFVLPGVICVALVQRGYFGAGVGPATSKDTYPFMITHLLPIGLKGLVTAAMLAAAMQTCSAALNSTATLVAYDLFKRHRAGLGRRPRRLLPDARSPHRRRAPLAGAAAEDPRDERDSRGDDQREADRRHPLHRPGRHRQVVVHALRVCRQIQVHGKEISSVCGEDRAPLIENSHVAG